MTLDITEVRPHMRPNGNDFADGTLNPSVELRAPPLAPNETTAAGHVLLRVDTFRPAIARPDQPDRQIFSGRRRDEFELTKMR